MRILVADDHAEHRRLLRTALARMGHEATLVEDGEAAWAAYTEGSWPVVITDWRMPGLDGLELTRRIRARSERQYPWLIMVTAHQGEEDFAAIMDAGVDDFLPKPLDLAVLGARLRVAERVLAMMSQVRELESMLPICIYCKSIRNRDSTWQRLENYLQEHIRVGLSHGLCPDCYYDRELAHDLGRLREQAPRAADSGEAGAGSTSAAVAITEEGDGLGGDLCRALPPDGLDQRSVEHLRRFDHLQAPGLLDDLANGFVGVATRELPRLLDDYAGSGYCGPAERRRFGRFRQRCQDLGALRLAALLDPIGLLEGARVPEARDRLVSAIRASLSRVLPEVQSLSATVAAAAPAAGNGAHPARSAR